MKEFFQSHTTCRKYFLVRGRNSLALQLTENNFHSDLARLKQLNAMILTELTISYSDMERSIYLNAILLSELKKFLQKEHELVMNEKEVIMDFCVQPKKTCRYGRICS